MAKTRTWIPILNEETHTCPPLPTLKHSLCSTSTTRVTPACVNCGKETAKLLTRVQINNCSVKEHPLLFTAKQHKFGFHTPSNPHKRCSRQPNMTLSVIMNSHILKAFPSQSKYTLHFFPTHSKSCRTTLHYGKTSPIPSQFLKGLCPQPRQRLLPTFPILTNHNADLLPLALLPSTAKTCLR